MPKKQNNKDNKNNGGDDPQANRGESIEPSRAVIAIHPSGDAVAVAVGPQLRVFVKQYAFSFSV